MGPKTKLNLISMTIIQSKLIQQTIYQEQYIFVLLYSTVIFTWLQKNTCTHPILYLGQVYMHSGLYFLNFITE